MSKKIQNYSIQQVEFVRMYLYAFRFVVASYNFKFNFCTKIFFFTDNSFRTFL